MTRKEVENLLRRYAEPEFSKKYSLFGINAKNSFGVRHPCIKKVAREIRTNHALAIELVDHPIHEARLLAPLIADPTKLTATEADYWVRSFYSWDLVDNASGLFARSVFGYTKALEWCKKEDEFIRRSGLVTLISLTIHDKKASDEFIESFLEEAEKYAFDDRKYVKKAINWLIRQIGKRNLYLNEKAIEVAERLGYLPLKSAQWIAKDALKELKSEQVLNRLNKKKPDN